MILFRCDAGRVPEIGTGHFIRSLSIANSLVKKKIIKKEQIAFCVRTKGVFSLGNKIIQNNEFKYKLFTFDNKSLVWNSAKEANALMTLKYDILVVDRLDTDAKWIKKIRSSFKRIISFDDNGSGAKYTNLTINGIINSKAVTTYSGYKYLFLNIFEAQKIYFKKINHAKYIFVSFGGYDHRNLLIFFLKLILKNVRKFNELQLMFEIITGNINQTRLSKIKNLICNIETISNLRFNVFQSPLNFYKGLLNADLVICSGGLTFFESVALQKPLLAFPQYPHQLSSILKLSKLGVQACPLNNMKLNNKLIIDSFLYLLNTVNSGNNPMKNGSKIINFNSNRRVIKLLTREIQSI
jgi:spore coat polysaccharide biosynthesis predicted glycosyltransferase SpsG